MAPPGYREHYPTGLAAWAECAWERCTGHTGEVARVIPDGCMDLICSPHAGLVVVGPNSTAFLALVPAGSWALGVRLHPGCAPPLFGVPADALLNSGVGAAELWGDVAARLEQDVLEAESSRARRLLLLGWLGRRARAAAPPDPLVQGVIGQLMSAPGTRVGALAGELGVSDRQLLRRVGSQVGYGPKRLGRVLRLRRALDDIRAGTALAEAAFAAGYVDQAHFTNDCRELAGVPPMSVFSKTAAPDAPTMRA